MLLERNMHRSASRFWRVGCLLFFVMAIASSTAAIESSASSNLTRSDWLYVTYRVSDSAAILLRLGSIETKGGLLHFQTRIDADTDLLGTILTLGKSGDWTLFETSAADCASLRVHMYRREIQSRSGGTRRVAKDEPPDSGLLKEYAPNTLIVHAAKAACSWGETRIREMFMPSPPSSPGWKIVAHRHPDGAPVYLDTESIRSDKARIYFVKRVRLAGDSIRNPSSAGLGGVVEDYEWVAADCSLMANGSYARQARAQDGTTVLLSAINANAAPLELRTWEIAAMVTKEACQISKSRGLLRTEAERPTAAEPQRHLVRLETEFFPPSPNAQWHNDANARETIRLLDVRSLRERDGRVMAWLQSSPRIGAGSTLNFATSKCSDKKHVRLVLYRYEKPFLDGNVVAESRESGDVPLNTPASGSDEEAEMEFMCRSWAARQGGGSLEIVPGSPTDDLTTATKAGQGTSSPAEGKKQDSQPKLQKKPTAPPKSYSNPF